MSNIVEYFRIKFEMQEEIEKTVEKIKKELYDQMKEKLELIFKECNLIETVVSYKGIDSYTRTLIVYYEMPKHFVNDCAFVSAMTQEGYKILITLKRNPDGSVNVANQFKKAVRYEEPLFNYSYKFIQDENGEIKVLLMCCEDEEIYKSQRIYYKILTLNPRMHDFVDKEEIKEKDFLELFNKGVCNQEDLKQNTNGPKRKLEPNKRD